MSLQKFDKDPAAVLDYGIDWDDEDDPWLASGETITASAWTVATGITKDSDSFSDTVTTVWLSGGTAGEEYDIKNTITTSAGRTDERTLTVKVDQR